MNDVQTRQVPYWNGMLCEDTRDVIIDRMKAVLDDQWFTFIACNSYDKDSEKFTSIDVKPSQRLRDDGIRPFRDEDVPAGISWSITDLVMGVHTYVETVGIARNSTKHDRVQFTFEPGRVIIDHYAPAGYALRWMFVVEDHREY